MKRPIAVLAAIAGLAAAQGQRKFTGVVTDSMCSSADHKGMRMGPTDAECTVACVLAHGALYVLYDGKGGASILPELLTERTVSERLERL